MKQKYKNDITANIYELAKTKENKKKVYIKRSKQNKT